MSSIQARQDLSTINLWEKTSTVVEGGCPGLLHARNGFPTIVPGREPLQEEIKGWFDSLHVRLMGNWPFASSLTVAYDEIRHLALCGSGVSNDNVRIMVATDRKGNPTMQVAKIGRVVIESVEKTFGGFVSKSNTLCSDSPPSIISWASGRELEHHTFVACKQHVKNKCFHVQHVNSPDNLYERWVKRFCEVSTEHLPLYLNRFVFLEKSKNSVSPMSEMATVVSANANALITWRAICKLYNTHYS